MAYKSITNERSVSFDTEWINVIYAASHGKIIMINNTTRKLDVYYMKLNDSYSSGDNWYNSYHIKECGSRYFEFNDYYSSYVITVVYIP